MKYLQAVAVVFLAIGGTTAEAIVLADDARIVAPDAANPLPTFLTPPASVPGVYLAHDRQLILTKSALPGDGLFLLEVTMPASQTFSLAYSGVAESFSLFLAQAGERLDTDYVNTRASLVNNWNSPGVGTLVLAPGERRLIGYWDDRTFDGLTIATNDDLFGWAEVENLGGELVVTASATARGGGIVVGTLQQIPEPNPAIALCLALALLMRLRRRPPMKRTHG